MFCPHNLGQSKNFKRGIYKFQFSGGVVKGSLLRGLRGGVPLMEGPACGGIRLVSLRAFGGSRVAVEEYPVCTNVQDANFELN